MEQICERAAGHLRGHHPSLHIDYKNSKIKRAEFPIGIVPSLAEMNLAGSKAQARLCWLPSMARLEKLGGFCSPSRTWAPTPPASLPPQLAATATPGCLTGEKSG